LYQLEFFKSFFLIDEEFQLVSLLTS